MYFIIDFQKDAGNTILLRHCLLTYMQMFSVKGRMLTCTNVHYNTKIQKCNIQIFRTCSLSTQICTVELLPLSNRYTLKQQNTMTQPCMAACIDSPNIYWNFTNTTHTHTVFICGPSLVISLSSKQSSLSTPSKKSALCSADSLAHQSTIQKHRL